MLFRHRAHAKVLSLLALVALASFARSQEVPSATDRETFAQNMRDVLDSTLDFSIVIEAKEIDHSVLCESFNKANGEYVRRAFSNSELGQLLLSKNFTEIVITNGKEFWTARPCKGGFCQPTGPSEGVYPGADSAKRVNPSVGTTLISVPTPPVISDEDFLKIANLQGRISGMPTTDLAGSLQRVLFVIRMSREAIPGSAVANYLSSEGAKTADHIHSLLTNFPDYHFDKGKYFLPDRLKAFSPATVVARDRALQLLNEELTAEVSTLPSFNDLRLDTTSLALLKSILATADFARITSTLRDVDLAHYRLAELQNELEQSQSKVRILAAKGEYYEGDGAVVITVLQTRMQVITSADPNGYHHVVSRPLQRLIVSVGGPHPGEGITLGGGVSGASPRTFDGHGSTADLLCLENCPTLGVGATLRLQLGRYITHESPHTSTEDYSYDNVPYLSRRGENGLSAWQILELCSGPTSEQCLAVSTVNSRE
jgi:hypothetical protein